MERIIYTLSLSIVLTFNAIAQEKDSILIPTNEKGFAEYTEVIPVDSVPKDNLYVNALEWINKTFKSGKYVIQTTDKGSGMIIGKANMQRAISIRKCRFFYFKKK